MSKIKVKTIGIRGHEPKIQEQGMATVFIDGDDSDHIAFDAFTGFGDSYKRREETLINVVSDGKIIYSGTFGVLVEIIKKIGFIE